MNIFAYVIFLIIVLSLEQTICFNLTTTPPPPEKCPAEMTEYEISSDARIGSKFTVIIPCALQNIQVLEFSKNNSIQFVGAQDLAFLRKIQNHIIFKVLRGFEDVLVTLQLTTSNETFFINVTLTNVNDAPEIQNLTKSVINLPENEDFKLPIHVFDPDDENNWGEIEVTSPDLPQQFGIIKQNNSLFYLYLQDLIDAELFKGSVYTDYNYEYDDDYGPALFQDPQIRITLKATDGGGLSSQTQVQMKIEDVNDNSPVCAIPSVIQLGRSDWSGNEPLYDILAFDIETYCTDNDLTERNQIQYNYTKLVSPCDQKQGFYMSRGYSTVYIKTPVPKEITSCPISLTVSDGKFSEETNFTIKFLPCPASEFNGLFWKEGFPGKESMLKACPMGYSGHVTRFCSFDGVYYDPVYNCTNRNLTDINFSGDDMQKLNRLEKIVVGDNGSSPLYAGDLMHITYILRDVTQTVKMNSTTRQNASSDFINIVNSVIGEERTEAWTGIINNTGSGVEKTIHTLDLFLQKMTMAMEPDEEPMEFAKSNLFLSLGNTKDCTSDLEFPDKMRSSAPTWAKSRKDSIYIACDNNLIGQKYSGSMFRNVSKYIPTDFAGNSSSRTLNGPVLGFSVYSSFSSKVTITFQIFDKSLRNPQCSYWRVTDSYTGVGNWSTDGCRLHRYSIEDGTVVCICDHLTNFAVLMSPADSAEISEEHIRALSIISLVGCIISMLCLAITVAVYVFFWRTLKTDRSMILINLCLALFVAYLIFLSGVNQTSNKAACTAISVLLHYIFLVVFCLMLAQGIVLGTNVLLPFVRKKLALPLTITAYVLPMVIVGISMGSTQLKGYGNEKCCWLDVDTGLIWAFLVPVLFVILLNAIVIIIGLKKLLGTTTMAKKSNTEKTKAAFKGLCVLLPVMGVTWILGIFSVSSETVVFQYMFSIFNSLQGLLIMVFNCILDKKVQLAYKTYKTKIIKPKDETVTSSSRTEGLSSGKSTTDTGL